MATEILASGITAATSTDVVVAAGASVVVGLFVTDGTIQPGMCATVVIDTPGAQDNVETRLDNAKPQTVLVGPGTYRVRRPQVPAPFGVYTG